MEELEGKKVMVFGYFNGITGDGKYINIITAEAEELFYVIVDE